MNHHYCRIENSDDRWKVFSSWGFMLWSAVHFTFVVEMLYPYHFNGWQYMTNVTHSWRCISCLSVSTAFDFWGIKVVFSEQSEVEIRWKIKYLFHNTRVKSGLIMKPHKPRMRYIQTWPHRQPPAPSLSTPPLEHKSLWSWEILTPYFIMYMHYYCIIKSDVCACGCEEAWRLCGWRIMVFSTLFRRVSS